MKFIYFSILILSFQVIFFANARNNQSQNGSNGKEIDTTSATSLDNRREIFGRGFEDLHRRIARPLSPLDSLNYQVNLFKFVSVVEFRNTNNSMFVQWCRIWQVLYFRLWMTGILMHGSRNMPSVPTTLAPISKTKLQVEKIRKVTQLPQGIKVLKICK